MRSVTSESTRFAGLENIVRPGQQFERIGSGFRFVEGPAWHAAGAFLVFSDITGNTMYRWEPRAGLSIFRVPSNMANGTAWDRDGRLLVCEHATSRVSRIEAEGAYEILVSHYQGRELNSPNDIVVDSRGDIFFTDPNSGRGAKYGVERDQQLEFQGVFRLHPRTGELTLLVDDFARPNGLCFSLDESRLFVNDTDRQHIRVFEVRDDGTLSGGETWAETGGDEAGVADGMKLDSAGNLYCCGSGGIHVFEPGGGRLGVIRTPEVAANFTWGGADLTDLFITATHSVYRLGMMIPGQG